MDTRSGIRVAPTNDGGPLEGPDETGSVERTGFRPGKGKGKSISSVLPSSEKSTSFKRSLVSLLF